MASRVAVPLLVAFVLLLRLPFLNQAIQGDDVKFLAGAEHAQIEPAHPNHFQYVFLGGRVDMSGHPHPPLNAWFLAALLAMIGDVREVPFHAAYVTFSLIAALAMWPLARRFSPQPMWATLLFLATPVFVINGNSLESDVPFTALWLAGAAFFVYRRWALAAGFLALASLTAYQAFLFTPILAVYVWLNDRRSRAAWAVALVPPLVIAAFQLYEVTSTGSLPASVLAGHFDKYGFQRFANKLKNAAALSVHLCWIVFPALLRPAFVHAWRSRLLDSIFLTGWITIYFAGALAIFFAGSARYLLPIAAPIALLASRLPTRWLAPAFAIHLLLGLALAWTNYQHWDAYRSFAASLRDQTTTHRTWIAGEWGLRFYLESDGALPLTHGQAVRPGDIVVSSQLAYPVAFTTGGASLTPIAEREIRPTLPFRLIGLGTRSAYSTADGGFLPFDLSTGPLDRIRAELAVERTPTLEFLSMKSPEAAHHIVSGVYELESNGQRWMSGRAVLLLKSPAEPRRLAVRVYIPGVAPARVVSIALDGEAIVARTFPASGMHVLETAPLRPRGATATISISVDKTFSVPGDRRELGVVLIEGGFSAAPL